MFFCFLLSFPFLWFLQEVLPSMVFMDDSAHSDFAGTFFFEDVPPTFSSKFPWIFIQISTEKDRKFIGKSVRKRNSHSERHFLIFWLTFLHFLRFGVILGASGEGRGEYFWSFFEGQKKSRF